MTNKTIISLLCMGAMLPVSAQVSKEITVEREVVPTLRDVSPLTFTPSVNLPTVEKPRLSYSERTITARIPTLFSLLEPAAVADSIEASPWRGYAAIGYFPSFNLGASAGYRLINTRTTTLDAWLQYDGSSYKLSKEDREQSPVFMPTDGNVKNQSGALGLRLSNNSSAGSSFDLDVNYALDHFNNPYIPIILGSMKNQTVHRLNLDGQYSSHTNDLGYSLGASYNLYSPALGYKQNGQYLSPVRENLGRINGALFAQINDVSSYRVDVEAAMISWSRGAAAQNASNYWFQNLGQADGKTSGLVTITPAYRFASRQFTLNLGARIDLSINDDKFFHVAPDVKAAWTPNDFFALYCRAGGGEHINTMGSLFALDRHIAPVFRYDFSHIPVEAEAGLRVGPFRGASLSLSAAYGVANRWLMPYGLTLGTMAMQSLDMRGWQFRAAIDYNLRNIATLSLAATASPRDKDDVEKGYYMNRDRARYTLDAELTLHPLDQLDIMLGYELRACRTTAHYYIRNINYGATARSTELPAPGITTVGVLWRDLPNLANLRAGASWRFTPAFTVFARLENILGRKTPSYALIPGQGFTGLVGVAYKF